jgi:hypothetical protein
MQQVGSWIWSLQGSAPAGGKEPQGDKVDDPSSALAMDSISSK